MGVEISGDRVGAVIEAVVEGLVEIVGDGSSVTPLVPGSLLVTANGVGGSVLLETPAPPSVEIIEANDGTDGTDGTDGNDGPRGINVALVETEDGYPDREYDGPVAFFGPSNPFDLGLMLVGDLWFCNSPIDYDHYGLEITIYEYVATTAQASFLVEHDLGHNPIEIQVTDLDTGSLCEGFDVSFPSANESVLIGFDIPIRALIRLI